MTKSGYVICGRISLEDENYILYDGQHYFPFSQSF